MPAYKIQMKANIEFLKYRHKAEDTRGRR